MTPSCVVVVVVVVVFETENIVVVVVVAHVDFVEEQDPPRPPFHSVADPQGSGFHSGWHAARYR